MLPLEVGKPRENPGNPLPGSQEVVCSSLWADSLADWLFALENEQWLHRKKNNTFYRLLNRPLGCKVQDWNKNDITRPPPNTFTLVYEGKRYKAVGASDIEKENLKTARESTWPVTVTTINLYLSQHMTIPHEHTSFCTGTLGWENSNFCPKLKMSPTAAPVPHRDVCHMHDYANENCQTAVCIYQSPQSIVTAHLGLLAFRSKLNWTES